MRGRSAGAAAHIRYPLPTTVSISGGSPSLRRSRVIVTETMLLNGSTFGVPDVLEQFLGADQGAVGGQQHLQDPELLAGQRERRGNRGWRGAGRGRR